MRYVITVLVLIAAVGCSTGPRPEQAPAARQELTDTLRTTTSTASLEGGRESGSTVRISAGDVRVVHSVFGSARLRGTHLQGLEDHNRHVQYSWSRDGRYRVEVSGQYRHRVSGAVVGNARLVSRITYVELPDTAR